MTLALVLSMIAAAYNNLINRWGPFHGWAYVPINLAFAGVMTASVVASGVELGGVGFGGDAGFVAIVAGGVVVYGILVQALARSRHGHRIADERVAGLEGAALAWHLLGRIPLGTAVAEEVVFRGVLFAAWREAGMSDIGAALCASVAFGLWHITPTTIGVKMNDAGPSKSKLTLAVAGAVAATTVAGLGLTWLRLEGGGLWAPIVLHAGVNSGSAYAAVRAIRVRSTRH